VIERMSIEALLSNDFGQNPQTRADEYDSLHAYHQSNGVHTTGCMRKKVDLRLMIVTVLQV